MDKGKEMGKDKDKAMELELASCKILDSLNHKRLEILFLQGLAYSPTGPLRRRLRKSTNSV